MNARSLLVLLLIAGGCGGGSHTSAPLGASGTSWPEADGLFHQEPLWLGGDGAFSVDVGGGRSLWLFGDSFVATSPAHLRSQSGMPRNTIAIQEGRDPSTAAMRFFWNSGVDGKPTSFFPDGADTWVWPGAGLRLAEGPLVIFLAVERAMPGQGLGFASAGWRIAIVDSPDEDPSTWTMRYLDPAPASFDAVVGCAAVVDGDHLVAVAPRSDTHAGHLARFLPADLLAGRLAPEWWAGDGRGWVAEADLQGTPVVVLPAAGTEASLHHDATLSSWIYVTSRGFGATTVAIRSAPTVTGPWSDPVDAFTPPESSGAKPFVYAAKGHAELAAAGSPNGDDRVNLVATYATNSFTFSDLLTAEGMTALYWPRFVRIAIH